MISASRHIGEGNRLAMHKLVGQGHGPLHGAIGHDEVLDALFVQVTGHQVDSVTRADQ